MYNDCVYRLLVKTNCSFARQLAVVKYYYENKYITKVIFKLKIQRLVKLCCYTTIFGSIIAYTVSRENFTKYEKKFFTQYVIDVNNLNLYKNKKFKNFQIFRYFLKRSIFCVQPFTLYNYLKSIIVQTMYAETYKYGYFIFSVVYIYNTCIILQQEYILLNFESKHGQSLKND